jgi:hypothetical protein
VRDIPPDSAHDLCGFCQDGTPCICAEMAAEDARDQAAAATSLHNAALHQSSGTTFRTGMNQLAQFTPPPSEGDVASTPQSLPPVSAGSKPNPCASGAGTCVQCRSDPNSTLFCLQLAASRSHSNARPVGCCGGSGSIGCCDQNQHSTGQSTRSSNVATAASSSQQSTASRSSITLTCADAYMTLSRHPGYERASAVGP